MWKISKKVGNILVKICEIYAKNVKWQNNMKIYTTPMKTCENIEFTQNLYLYENVENT